MAIKGYFKPKNPKKYKGNPANIVYRSSYELKLMMRLDLHQDVIWWGSEEQIIPYRSPIDNKIHRYFPDFIVCIKTPEDNKKIIMIEVKPKHQIIEPVKKKEKTDRKYIKEVFTYGVNQAKWKAAKEFCANRGWEFQIFTESELGIK
jgi:hypothetical protein